MDMFRGVLAVGGCSVRVDTAVWKNIPASLRLVSKENVSSIVPSQETIHALRKLPWLTSGLLVHPVSHWSLEIGGMSIDETGEFAFESGEHVVEGKCVGREVDPAGVGGEDSHSLAWPETIGLTPVSDIRVEFLHVGGKSSHIVFPGWSATLSIQILFEDAGPLGAADVLIKSSDSLATIHTREVHTVGKLDVGLQLLVSLVILEVERATFILNDSGESIKISSSSGGGDLGSETVSTDGGHSDLLRVHPADNISSDVIHIVAGVMVRCTLVSVIEHPDIADIQDLIASHTKEAGEVLCWLKQLREPYHGW